MITTYLRSSSYTAYDFCEHKCYLDYCLGFHSPANKAAQKGTITHKALEVLAQLNITKRQGATSFTNSELQTKFTVATCTPDLAVKTAYEHYKNKKEFNYTDSDLTECSNWMYTALFYKNGMFSPLKLNIISAEQFFDLVVDKPWAKYSYTFQGKKLNGQLKLKGTLDLVVQREDNVIEIIDWKTGARFDWINRKVKEYEDFYHDPQVRLYHYAAAQLYPEASNILFTIFWLKDGGPFTVCFSYADVLNTERMIRKRFQAMRDNKNPKLIYPNKRCGWCHHNNHDIDGNTSNYDNSVCAQTHKEILDLGIDKVTNQRIQKGFSNYFEGGGKTHT